MTKTILIAGYGPGISEAVARKFGAEGFSVALAARSESKVEAAAAALRKDGIRAAPFVADLGDPAAVKRLVSGARAKLGPITVIHWNAYANVAGDLLSADVAEARQALDVGVVGLIAAVQEALPDLKSQKDAAILVTGGGLAYHDPKVDKLGVGWKVMGLAIAKSAQHKLAGLLAERLRDDGVYVGEVVVLGTVQGTPFDAGGGGSIAGSTVADKFWELYTGRKILSVDLK